MTRSTTYAELTSAALEGIVLAKAATTASSLPDHGTLEDAAAAHGDLTAALAHLGRTIAGPGGEPSDLPLIERLESIARPRDWAAPGPSTEPGVALDHSARLTRAAADLWSTHHTTGGAPRSPEATRLRHPAVLGAAYRAWRGLIAAAADSRAALDARAEELRIGDPEYASPESADPVIEYPRPAPSETTAPPAPVRITVARPSVRTTEGPMLELTDRVNRLRHLAWSLAAQGMAPAHVLRNLAATGAALGQAAAQASRAAAKALPRGSRRDDLRAAANGAAQRSEAWRAVAEQIAALRTPHPANHSIQIERIQIERLLRCVTTTGAATPLPATGEELVRLVYCFDDVARFNALGLRRAHSKGDVLIAGRALPREALEQRDDLLRARLANTSVRAPRMSVRRVERAYRAITDLSLSQSTPRLGPPAA